MKKYLEQIAGKIPVKDWTLFKEITFQEQRLKGDTLLEFNKKCRYIWFLKKGAVRKIENINGTLKTTHFYIAPFMFTVYRSLLRDLSSQMSIICETDCEFEVLLYSDLVALYNHSHPIERVGRIMAEHQYIEEFDLRRVLLNMDALQRYEYLEANQPEIFQYFQL